MNYELEISNKKYNYLLDSIRIIDDNNMYFGSLLTCNKDDIFMALVIHD